MRVRTDRAVGRLAAALVASLLLGWLANWWVPSPQLSCPGVATPDCGIVIRDRP